MRIPDNFDLYDAYEREQARQEKHQPKCDWCGEAMWEFYYKIGDDRVCDRCIDDCKCWID